MTESLGIDPFRIKLVTFVIAALLSALSGWLYAHMSRFVSPAPFDADGLDWLDGMSALNVEEFTRARDGEDAYRPMAEHLARDAVAAAERGGLAVADDYALAESDRGVLTAQARSSTDKA